MFKASLQGPLGELGPLGHLRLKVPTLLGSCQGCVESLEVAGARRSTETSQEGPPEPPGITGLKA